MSHRFLLCTLLASTTFGCGSGESPGDAPSGDPAGGDGIVPVVDNREPAWERPWTVDSVPLFRIGDAAGQPEYELFRTTGAFLLSDGRLVIGNAGTHEIRYYDSSGSFIRSVGGEGDGPGELRTPFLLIPLPADTIAAGDLRLARLSIFDPAGEFVRSASYASARMSGLVAHLSSGKYLFATQAYAVTGEDTGPVRPERYRMDVSVFDEATASMDTIVSLPWVEMVIGPTGTTRSDGSPMVGARPRSFGHMTWLVGALGGGFVVGDNARPELELHDGAGALTTIVRWPMEERAVTADDIERELEHRLSQATSPELRRVLETSLSQHPPADIMPFFGCAYHWCPSQPLLVDAEGNLWVRQYEPPADTGPHRYLVFDSGGVWLGHLQMPAGLGLVWVGSDHLVARTTTDLGVEIISVHRLNKQNR
jgi:hypothetical protein